MKAFMPKAPDGADAFDAIETALLQASLDANAEISGKWPVGKARDLEALQRKAKAIDVALDAVDELRDHPHLLPLFDNR